MAITLGELLIKLTAKTDAFQKGMNDAKRLAFDSSADIVTSLGKIGESLAKLKFDNLNQVAASLSRVGGIIAGVTIGIAAASVTVAERVAQQAKEIDKLSQSYGLSVQQVSSFRVAAQITGVSLETITGGMSRLAKNAATVAESVGGSSSRGAGAAFKALGISITPAKVQTANMNDLLGEVAEKFSKLAPGVEKTALAIQIFGKSGAAMIPFLNEGKEGLEKLRQLSDDLGTTWSEKDVQAARAFGESVEILKLKGQALEEQYAKGLYPALDNIVTVFAKVDAGGNSVAYTLGTVVGEAFKFAAEAAAVFRHDTALVSLELEKLASYTYYAPFTKAGDQVRAGLNSEIQSLDKQLADVTDRLNKPFEPKVGKSGTDSAAALGGDTKEAIKNWAQIAEWIKQANADQAALLLSDQQSLELEQKITKELRDQHALKDFPVSLKFNPTVPEQSPENTTRDQFNADRLKKYTDALKDTQNLLHLQASIFEQTETSAEKYNYALQQLGVLLQKRLIDQETFNRAVNNLGVLSTKALDGARAFFQQYADAAKETGRQVYDALSNAFEGINNNLAEMIVKGKADWKSLLDDIETSIVKISLQKLEGSLITKIGKAFGIDLGGSGKPTGASGDPIHTIVDNSNDFGSLGGGSQDSSDGGGGLFGGILGKIFGFFGGGSGGDGATSGAASDPGFFSGGQRAIGGPVSAGVLYRVNERGRDAREYFKPNVSGQVIPLGQMAAAGGGFTFAPTYYISTPNADTFRKSQHQLITEGLDSANRAQRRR